MKKTNVQLSDGKLRKSDLYKLYITEGWRPILRKPLYGCWWHIPCIPGPDGADTLAPLPSPPAPAGSARHPRHQPSASRDISINHSTSV